MLNTFQQPHIKDYYCPGNHLALLAGVDDYTTKNYSDKVADRVFEKSFMKPKTIQ